MSDVFLLGLRDESFDEHFNDYVGIKFESGDAEDVSLWRDITMAEGRNDGISGIVKVLNAIDRQKLLLSNSPEEIEKIIAELY